jgi:hypothetical protein
MKNITLFEVFFILIFSLQNLMAIKPSLGIGVSYFTSDNINRTFYNAYDLSLDLYFGENSRYKKYCLKIGFIYGEINMVDSTDKETALALPILFSIGFPVKRNNEPYARIFIDIGPSLVKLGIIDNSRAYIYSDQLQPTLQIGVSEYMGKKTNYQFGVRIFPDRANSTNLRLSSIFANIGFNF